MQTTSITINIAQEQEQKARNLLKRFVAVNSEIQSIADYYAEELRKDGSFKSVCVEVGLDISILNNLERIAKKTMHPDLLFAEGKIYNEIKKLPYSEQTRILEAGKVEVCSGDGTVLNVALDDLTDTQRKIVFGNGIVRSISAQRAFIESLKIEKQIKESESPASLNYRWSKKEGKDVLIVGQTEYRWEDVNFIYGLYVDKLTNKR
jgi:hypothetical protein